MKSKLLTILTSIMLLCLCLFTLTACESGDNGGDTPPTHEHSFTNYVSDNNATLDADGTKTAKCDNCDATDTIIDVGSMLVKEGITFKTLKVSGNTVYGKVSNTTETFSFINEIKVTGRAKFIVALDLYGTQEVKTKTIPLEIGDNKVYVTEYVGDEPIRVYTVTVRRRPMYSVTFNVNGGSAVENQVVEEDSLAIKPTTAKVGYSYTWDYVFSKPIVKDTHITATWNANKDTKYVVEYYHENLNNNSYTKVQTLTKTGTTDTTAKADIKNYDHFTYNSTKSISSGNINANGSLVLKVYYNRNVYKITTQSNNAKAGSVTSGGNYKFDKEFVLTATTNAGYTFNGWYEGETLVCKTEKFTVKSKKAVTYTAKWSANKNTKYIVKYYLENLGDSNYTLTDTDELTGTTDTTAKADIKNYDHFTYNSTKSISSGNINGNGSLILSVYYTRDIYTVTTQVNNTESGSVTSGGNYQYGKQITLTATTNAGYAFNGWYKGETLVFETEEIKLSVDKSITYTAKFAVKEEMKNFNFTSTTTTCEVTSIKNNKSTITEIVIPNYVTSIGSSAFYSCNSLTSVTIGNGVTSIGSSAFSGCYSLTSIVIPDSVTSIGSSAFEYCYKLVEVINNSPNITVEKGSSSNGYLGYYALSVFNSGDTYINRFTTDSNGYVIYTEGSDKILVNYVGSQTELTLPSDITKINQYAFYYNGKITSVVIPDSVTSIGDSAFSSCSSLTKVNYLGTIDSWAQIEFGDSCSNPIYYAKNLYINDVHVTNAVLTTATKISNYAFYSCDSLTSIVIPDSVTSIGSSAFEYCYKLVEVINNSSYITVKKGSEDNGYLGYYALSVSNCDSSYITKVSTDSNGYVIYTDGEDKILVNYVGGQTELTLPSDITKINNYAFYNYDKIVSIVIPGSVTSIGYQAFAHCDSLTSVVIGDSVTSIGNYAFYDCSSLTSIEIPNSVTSIGNHAFEYCDSLTSVTIGNGVTSIGSSAFYDCSIENASIPAIAISSIPKDKLKTVVITNGESIGYRAFYNCSKLTSIVIPDSVTSIGDSAFSSCSSLGIITLPFVGNTLNGTTDTHFGYIFGASECAKNNQYVPPSLKTVVITGGKISSYAFYDCDLLTSVTIGDSVKSIGNRAFEYCSSLTSVTIGNGVKSIGSFVFYDCDLLTSVSIGDSVRSIGYNAFYNCYKLVEVINKSPNITVEKGSFDNGHLGRYALSVSNCDSSYVSKVTIDSDGYVIYTEGSDKILVNYVGGQTKLTLPSSITKINNYAFYNNDKLVSIVIPNSVTSIGSSAFDDCDSLTSITFNDTSTWYRTTSNSYWENKTGGTQTSVTNSSTNATYFKSNDYDYWYKI